MVVDGSEVKTTSVEKMYKFFIFLIVCYDSMNVCIYIKEKKIKYKKCLLYIVLYQPAHVYIVTKCHEIYTPNVCKIPYLQIM